MTLSPLLHNFRLYRGRLAPSPTGLLHVGHARTFWIAAQRAAGRRGTLILRDEDLDPQRCRGEFAQAMIEDLHWLGISWAEGPDCGGPHAPYVQSERRAWYLEAWKTLMERGMIYPCTCSRKDVAKAAAAPNDADDEPLYSGKCRPQGRVSEVARLHRETAEAATSTWTEPAGVNWRFRVPDGEEIGFTDLHLGPQRMIAGRDFGDFIVWRRDDVPAYQLAVVVDDAAMGITEVVRGADLLKSTARQILLFRALGLAVPDYYHCDLVRDQAGVRLAKRHDSLSVRRLRKLGFSPEQVRAAMTPFRVPDAPASSVERVGIPPVSLRSRVGMTVTWDIFTRWNNTTRRALARWNGNGGVYNLASAHERTFHGRP